MDRNSVKALVDSHFDYLLNLRRHFHMYPELSGCEEETIRYICDELSRLCVPYSIVDNGGVIGIIDSGIEGKTMLLRADIDALPVTENIYNLSKKKNVVSTVEGICHACGHDGHMAILLTVGKILSENKHIFNGKVLMVFERGEEGTGNYKYLLDYLEKESTPIDYVWGLHLIPSIPSKRIAILPHTVFAGISEIKAEITGTGGHGSRPDLASNPILCFSEIMNSIQSIRMNLISPFNPLTFSFCYVHSGNINNVIPEKLCFGGTVRYLEMNSEKRFVEQFDKVVNTVCSLHGCSIECCFSEPRMPVINNQYCRDSAIKAISNYLNPDILYDCDPMMVSDTMAYTLNKWSGVYALLGINNLEIGTGAELHNSKFDIDENALSVGVTATIAYVLQLLN